MRRLPIRLRITLLAGLAAGLAATIIGGISLSHSSSAARQNFDASLSEEAAEFLIAVKNELPLSAFTHPDSINGDLLAGIFDGDGALIDVTAPGPVPFPVDLKLHEHSTVTDPATGDRYRLLALPVEGSEDSVMAVMISMSSLDERNRTAVRTVGILGLVAVGAVAVGSYLIAGFVLGPIETLTKGVLAIGGDPSGRRLELPPADDEVRHLAATFNAGLSRIDETMEAQRRFITDASHELRTPLARLRADIDLARRPTRTHEELVTAFEQIDEHAAHMTVLADSLLGMLAPSTGGSPAPTSMTANAILATVKARTMAGDGISFAMPEAGEAVLLCDVHGVVGSLSNLIQNAVQHGAPPIEVSARRSDSGLEFTVRDHGPGIPTELHRRVIEPFAQGPGAVNGTGLGLAIVAAFAERQGGELLIEDGDPGCRMVLRIPFSPLSGLS